MTAPRRGAGRARHTPGLRTRESRGAKRAPDEPSSRVKRATASGGGCNSREEHAMCIRRKMVAAVATLTTICGGIVLDSVPASAVTPECGSACGSVFSRELGTYADPNVVEAVLDGVGRVGQPVILKEASSSDPS